MPLSKGTENPLFAKISRPDTGKSLLRRRLFSLLKESRNYPVIWITSPAGSGKTTLAASYLETYNIPCLWYRVDEGDIDMAAFFYYMKAAVKKILPDKNVDLPFLTPEYLFGLPVFTKRYFETLYEHINSSVLKRSHRKNFYIVFDNYQDVPPGSKFHEILNYGLEEIPEGINIIILSRNEPLEQFIRLRANNKMRIIGWDELRFTREESGEIIKMKLKKTPGAEIVQDLHKYTEGWAAGLMLLLEKAKKNEFNLWPDSQAKNEIFNYYAKEIFDKSDHTKREFLLKTAYLSEMTVETAEKLTGNKEAKNILNNLVGNNYFIERFFLSVPMYQYHALFRDFLLNRAKEVYAPEEIITLQRLSAELLEGSGQIEDAAEIMFSLEDWKALINLILKSAQSLVAQGRNKTLSDWLERMPENIVKGMPWLLFWRGVSIIQFNPAQSLPFFEQAFLLFERNKDDRGVFLAWSAVVQSFLLDFNDFRPVDKWINRLDERLCSGFSFNSHGIEASVAASMTGVLAWRNASYPDKKKWLDVAFSMESKDVNTDLYFRVCTNSALHYIWMGEFAKGGLFVRQMEKVIKSKELSPLRFIIFKLTEAMLYNSSMDSQGKAAEAISEGLKIARESGVYLMNSSLLVQGAANSLNAGDLKKTLEFLSEIEKLPGESKRIHSSHYFYFSAWHNFLLKNIPQAAVLVKKSLQLIMEAGVPVSETLIRLLQIHILYESEDHEEAYRELATCKEILQETGSSYCEYLYCLTESYFAFKKNDDRSGIEALDKAMKLGRQKNYITMIYFWMPEVMSYLCAKALESGIEIEYTQKIIVKLNIIPCISCVEEDNWPWIYKINTFGKFEIIKEGNKIEFQGKIPKKPLLLLKALIILGGKEVAKQKLMDMLWPETEGDVTNISFDTTLNRLRKLLGNNEVVKYKEGKLMLDTNMCRVDALVFENILKQVESNTDEINNKKLIKKAVDIYKGDFLPGDEEYPWINSAREELQNKYRIISER